ncbi:MAG: hypothetical protein PF961_12615 [Planctomycetota bacterium]|jgi:hypothetical protein|nr:hypothetical protein [Planctomycetota bacterium]
MEISTAPAEAEAASRPGRLNLELAQAMIAAWHESGMSRAAYAEKVGICLKTFDRWRSRVDGSTRRSTAGLARVAIPAGAASPAGAAGDAQRCSGHAGSIWCYAWRSPQRGTVPIMAPRWKAGALSVRVG